MLILAGLGLFLFICGLGDARRKAFAVEQVRRYASALQNRVSAGGVLPLNLEPEPPREGADKLIPLEWLDRESAVAARDREQRIPVARTAPVSQWLGRDGRVVVYFEKGKFDVGWVRLGRSDAPLASPRDRVRFEDVQP